MQPALATYNRQCSLSTARVPAFTALHQQTVRKYLHRCSIVILLLARTEMLCKLRADIQCVLCRTTLSASVSACNTSTLPPAHYYIRPHYAVRMRTQQCQLLVLLGPARQLRVAAFH
eukprot:17496-Heterococcus_DN1.PRE.1